MGLRQRLGALLGSVRNSSGHLGELSEAGVVVEPGNELGFADQAAPYNEMVSLRGGEAHGRHTGPEGADSTSWGTRTKL